MVESGSHETIWRDPQHPYARALLAAVPVSAAARAECNFPRLHSKLMPNRSLPMR
ncbi:MAG: hypothetical protein ACRYGL_01165 [Janthinobacterium lividum]